jgi:hypothetical protein
MPNSPPFIIQTSTPYPPTVSNNVFTIYTPSSHSFAQESGSLRDLGVSIIVPEGYIAMVTSSLNSAYSVYFLVSPTVLFQGTTELSVNVMSLFTGLNQVIGANTPIVQVIFLKLTPAQSILSSS